MTRAEIRINIRRVIEDQGTFYTDTDLNNAIQECYTLYINETAVIEKRTTLSFIDDLVYYNFRTLVSDYLGTIAIYNNVTKQWLASKDRVNLDLVRKDWELSIGQARWFNVLNHELVALVPHQSVASGTFDLHYLGLAPTISSDTEVIKVLSESEHVFEVYATFYLMLQSREFNKANLSFNEFEKYIKDALLITNGRALPMRRYEFGGY